MSDRKVNSAICVTKRFERSWPYTADHWQSRWKENGPCELIRVNEATVNIEEIVSNPELIQRLVLLGFTLSSGDLDSFSDLEECYLDTPWEGQPSRKTKRYSVPAVPSSEEEITAAKSRGVSFIPHRVDVYWGQTVAEYALGMTICGLRRIPQNYEAMQKSQKPWDYSPESITTGVRGAQFGDDSRFINGTIAGKRIRVVGAGNIGARYASWCSAIGADVAIWDPFAPDATFRVAGTERRFHVEELVVDSDIFVPMVPLTDSTRGLITAELINMLPMNSLVVQVTRARICDTEALYRRVLNNELSLAADVFDEEPVALDSPLLGRENVVHTAHNAGRTKDSNHAFADDAIARFKPRF